MSDKKRSRSGPCPQCNRKAEYLSRWDSFYCPDCNIWTDDECNCDPEECEFRGRPDKPAHTIEQLQQEVCNAHQALGRAMIELKKYKDATIWPQIKKHIWEGTNK